LILPCSSSLIDARTRLKSLSIAVTIWKAFYPLRIFFFLESLLFYLTLLAKSIGFRNYFLSQHLTILCWKHQNSQFPNWQKKKKTERREGKGREERKREGKGKGLTVHWADEKSTTGPSISIINIMSHLHFAVIPVFLNRLRESMSSVLLHCHPCYKSGHIFTFSIIPQVALQCLLKHNSPLVFSNFQSHSPSFCLIVVRHYFHQK
jgi:hypothetical protein